MTEILIEEEKTKRLYGQQGAQTQGECFLNNHWPAPKTCPHHPHVTGNGGGLMTAYK